MTTGPANDATADERVVRTAELPDGARLAIRTAGPDDVDGLLALFDALSPEDRQRRFFSMFRPDRRFVERLVSLPERGGLVLVAEVRPAAPHEAPHLVAEASYALVDSGDGELDITVDRSARGWLAPYLLDALLEQAAVRGVQNLQAEVLLSNRPMLALLHARGCATIDDDDRTVVHATVGTCGAPGWPPHHDRPRVLVEIPGARWRISPSLRDEGVDVVACGGPASRRGGAECPMLRGEPCPLVEGADVVVFALRQSDERARALLDAHGRSGTRHLVVQLQPGERAEGAPADALVLDAPTVEQLRAAVESLLGLDATALTPATGAPGT